MQQTKRKLPDVTVLIAGMSHSWLDVTDRRTDGQRSLGGVHGAGKVREVAGETYMLNQDEELWEKYLPPGDEALLAAEKDPLADRGFYTQPPAGKDHPPQQQPGPAQKGMKRPPLDKTRVVSFRVPHNAAVQIYDYKEKKAR